MSTCTLSSLGITDAIDTHLHPWRLNDLPPVIQGARTVRPDLAQDYSPAQVIDTAAASGCSGVIFVQARDPHEGSRAEAEFFIAAAHEHPQVLGCIVGIDLLDTPSTERLINEIKSHTAVRGCRMIAPENLGVGILSDSRALNTAKLLGTHNLRLDLLIRSSNPGQLDEGVRLVQWLAHKSDTVVIGDHLLKPTGVGEGKPAPEWIAALSELARCGNFFLKLSGLPGEVAAGSDYKLFWPFFDAALEALGPTRLLFGSDHPVSYSHHASVTAVTEWLTERGLTQNGVAQEIFAESAKRAYAIVKASTDGDARPKLPFATL
jgi:L-fuconolactonase